MEKVRRLPPAFGREQRGRVLRTQRGQSLHVQNLLRLQAGAGNRAVSRLVSATTFREGQPVPSGHELARVPSLAKLMASRPAHPLQRDAEQSADGACCDSCSDGRSPCGESQEEKPGEDAGVVQRNRDGAEPAVRAAQPKGRLQVSRAPPPAPAAPLAAVGTLDQRTAAFKSLVKTTAVHRLMGNQTNLAQWVNLINTAIPSSDLAALGLVQGGGSRAYLEMQVIEDPMVREIRANQVMGRFRACTGCHLENQAWGTRQERSALGGPEWRSPVDQRAAFGDYRPPAGGSEARVNQLFPSPEATQAAMGRVKPILAALGPEGYKVLPGSIMTDVETGSFDSLRANISTNIDQRTRDYSELTARIRAGSVGYEHFGPIIRDLLAAADPEVRRAIQTEMDDHAFWAKVEAVVVGVLTVAALILTIFPPTSAGGLMALGALEAGLGVYGAVQGPGMIATGQAYSLSEGTQDVFSREQQEAGGGMVLGGFLGIALAPVAVLGGASRMMSAASQMGEASVLSLTAGQSLQRGKYLITMAEDGSLVAAVADRPDVLIVVRDGTATAYQVTGTGGLRVLESAPVMPGGAGTGAGKAGGGGAGGLPHVPQKTPNWCGAACGEMAAGRLGVKVGQEEIAAHKLFEQPLVIDGKVFSAGGFHTKELAVALEEVAPVGTRAWTGLSLPEEAVFAPSALRDTMKNYIANTKSSVILRVGRGDHWIVVDEVLPNGKIAIRDPGAKNSQLLTAEQLRAKLPTGDVVISAPKK